MLNGKAILRHNRATADLTEFLLNSNFKLGIEEIVPTIEIDACVVLASGQSIPLRVEMHESNFNALLPGSSWYWYEVSKIDENGELLPFASGHFNHNELSALQTILAAGHLVGDNIKFYYKGGK